MAVTLDNIELDQDNVEFNYAADFVNHTRQIIYLTGKAGTGKTTFLKYLKSTTNKNMVVLAPTGVAAMNAGGQTIHSFFLIRPSIYVPGDKRLRTESDFGDTDKSTIFDHFKYHKERLQIIKNMQVLVIDEISMVRCDLLDVVDRLLRVFRKRLHEPFGGVQVILIGDTFQLAPIAQADEWDILHEFYDTQFFFGSNVIKKYKPIYIELKKIYRQNEPDFIDLLNRVRTSQVTQRELDMLNSKYYPTFQPPAHAGYITLAATNRVVESTNLTRLGELPGEIKVFNADITGIFPDNIVPTERSLQLKYNAQVMFIKNDKSKKYHNGSIGTITHIDDNKITVVLTNGTEIQVAKEVWNNIKYTWHSGRKQIDEDIIGTFTQFPIKLAWAITVHKSQGLTFDNVIADLGNAFAPGQVYVALSRCTTFQSLVLRTRIERHVIKTDPQVLQFAQNETPGTLIVQALNEGKADGHYQSARFHFRKGDITTAWDHLVQAVQYRNDISTETFKRYIRAHIGRLQTNATNSKKALAAIQKNKTSIAGVLKLNKELDKQLTELKQKSDSQNNGVKLLLDAIAESERDLTATREQLKAAQEEITTLHKMMGKAVPE